MCECTNLVRKRASLGWIFWMSVPPFLLYVFVMLYLEFPESFRNRVGKALRHPAWAVSRSAGKFWHYRSRLQWFGILFVGALALFSVGEYGFGIFVLSLSGVSLLSKVTHWNGFAKHPVWTAILKGLGGLCVAFFNVPRDRLGTQGG